MEINVLKYQELITYRDFLCIDDYKKFINAIIDKYDTCMVFFEDKFKSKHLFSQTANTNLLNLKNHHIISIDTKEKKKEFKENLEYQIENIDNILNYDYKYNTNFVNYIYFIEDNLIKYSFSTNKGYIYKYCLDEYRFDNAINEIEKNKIKQMYNDDQVINDFIDFGVRISEIENYEDKENIFKLGCKVHSDIFKEYKEEYRNNIDIAFEAIKKSMHNYNYAGEDVKKNKKVLDYIKKKEEELFKDL